MGEGEEGGNLYDFGRFVENLFISAIINNYLQLRNFQL